MYSLLDLMFSEGLNNSLIDNLTIIVDSIPELLIPVQDKLLDIISITLSKSTYSKESKSYYPTTENPYTTILALKTLGSFNMRGHNLADFIKDCVVKFLEDENPFIRKEASITCCKRLINEKTVISTKGINNLKI
jgi:FKBP12-rapamycin complex-associated protein